MNIRIYMIIFMILSLSINLYAKGDGDGNNPVKDRGKNQKNLDTVINDKKGNPDIKNEPAKKFNSALNKNKIQSCIEISDKIGDILNKINREIKISGNDVSEITTLYENINTRINNLLSLTDEFINGKTADYSEISRQINEIKNAKKVLETQMADFKHELDKNKTDRKTLSGINRVMEKQVNIISRQFRAIDWILFGDN